MAYICLHTGCRRHSPSVGKYRVYVGDEDSGKERSVIPLDVSVHPVRGWSGSLHHLRLVLPLGPHRALLSSVLHGPTRHRLYPLDAH